MHAYWKLGGVRAVWVVHCSFAVFLLKVFFFIFFLRTANIGIEISYRNVESIALYILKKTVNNVMICNMYSIYGCTMNVGA